ncbi:MAG: hypothetical protein AAF787_02595, partial [Chloroflexota bacterium]
NTLDPIANDDPMGEDPQTPIADIADYTPKAARFVDGAARVWVLQLKRLPEVEQQRLLAGVLADAGYSDPQPVIDTRYVTGQVFAPEGEMAACGVRASG